jgi:hypothetical protein
MIGIDICAPSRSLNREQRQRAAQACELFGGIKCVVSALAILAILAEHDRMGAERVQGVLELLADSSRTLLNTARELGLARLNCGKELGQELEGLARAIRREAEGIGDDGTCCAEAAARTYLAGRRLGRHLWLLEIRPEGSNPTPLARDQFEPIGGWSQA